MKNCSNEVKNVIIQLEKYTSSYGDSRSSTITTTTSDELKSVNSWSGVHKDIGGLVYKLKNYLLVDTFAEEFISYEGIKKLVDVIQQSTGNTRVNKLLTYSLYHNIKYKHLVICHTSSQKYAYVSKLIRLY